MTTTSGAGAEHQHHPDDLADDTAWPPAPFAFGRLDKVQRGVVVTLVDAARQAEAAEKRLDGWVVRARSHGISWSLIGTLCGLTGEGARKRWGALCEPHGTRRTP